MKKTNILAKFYFENTIFGVIIIAVITFFINIIDSDLGNKILTPLIPLFITVTLLEIYFIRVSLSKNNSVLKIKKLTSTQEADAYLHRRLIDAKTLHILHFAGKGLYKKSELPLYQKSIKKFILDGKKFIRIIANTDYQDFWNWVDEDIQNYKNYNYSMYFLNNLHVGELRIMAMILIDSDEVIIGSPYLEGETFSMVSITGAGKFYYDYFNYFKDKSHPFCTEHEVHKNFTYIQKKKLKRKD